MDSKTFIHQAVSDMQDLPAKEAREHIDCLIRFGEMCFTILREDFKRREKDLGNFSGGKLADFEKVIAHTLSELAAECLLLRAKQHDPAMRSRIDQAWADFQADLAKTGG